MPIHDYDCQDCGHGFEELVLGDEAVECPKCESVKLKPRISTFSVGLSSWQRQGVNIDTSAGMSPGGTCDGGSCGTG